jgi:hypothetical protein
VLVEGLLANNEHHDLPVYRRSIRAMLYGGPARDDRASDEPLGVEVDDVDDLDHKDRDVDAASRHPTLTDVPAETTTVEEGQDLGELDAHTPPIKIQTAWRAPDRSAVDRRGRGWCCGHPGAVGAAAIGLGVLT